MEQLYVVSDGEDGPMVAGPYASYEVAIRARSGMAWRSRPWRRGFRLTVRYWVRPMVDEDWVH